MTCVLQPFHLLVIVLSGWLNRQQQAVIDYLIAENRVLKEQLEGQRLLFTDEQRIRQAVKAKVLGRRALDELETLVTPDTLLAWHRQLIAKKGDKLTGFETISRRRLVITLRQLNDLASTCSSINHSKSVNL